MVSVGGVKHVFMGPPGVTGGSSMPLDKYSIPG